MEREMGEQDMMGEKRERGKEREGERKRGRPYREEGPREQFFFLLCVCIYVCMYVSACVSLCVDVRKQHWMLLLRSCPPCFSH